MSAGFGSIFTVSNFASQAELAPILSEIPKYSTPDEYEAFRDDHVGPSRNTGRAMIEKMRSFQTDAERVYQSNMDKLDKARMLLAHPDKEKYLSLFEIADILLDPLLKTDDKFTPSALYAVHMALFRDEIGFRPLSPTSDCHRRDHLFEVFPEQFTNSVDRIATVVRKYMEARIKAPEIPLSQTSKNNPLGSFIEKAREHVYQSRRHRNWTHYGILTPSESKTVLPRTIWSASDREIIDYLKWWASFDLFQPGSRFGSYGAIILRALDLYDGARLNQSTAWTFLLEIGYYLPWELPSRYKVRLPGTVAWNGDGLYRPERLKQKDVDDSLRSDIASEGRVDRQNATVFCIDGPETMQIDDGISLEPTDRTDEYWIHIHTADPAAGIKPESELQKYIELIPETIYLQGHFQTMLSAVKDEKLGQSLEELARQYSLTSGSPALTFSARVNMSGEILDYKIEPSSLHKVVYLDPKDVATFCGEPAPPSHADVRLSVGTPPETERKPANRVMTTPSTLDESSQSDLLTLYRLAEAIKAKRLAKGAWPYFFPNATAKVLFSDRSETLADEKVTPTDPHITVSHEDSHQSSVVANTMVLAGQVAARWCADRGIPAPYRKDSRSAQNFSAALQYANDIIYPQIRKGIEPSQEQRAQLTSLTGSIGLSTSPGPYFVMGVDMYAKATSPLRRFGDLILHWQVHAALAHERAMGRQLDPAVDNLNEILPFSEAELDNKLALLQMREKMIRILSSGNKDWVIMALARAWAFENSAPKLFRFTVESSWRQGLLGRINWCSLNALMDLDHMGDLVLLKDVKVGDQFEVELAHIDVYFRDIRVRALKYLGSEEVSQADAVSRSA
jgi:hypothetical protein